MNKEEVKKLFDEYINDYAKGNQFGVSMIPAHQHTGMDSLNVDYADLANKLDFQVIRIVASGTNTAVASTVGGDFVMPYSGYFVAVGATVDTAGTTNNTVIDVLKNGVSIMSTTITINTATKTSRSATAQPIIKTVAFKTGDIITFDITGISTTPAKGLSMFLNTIIIT